MRFQELALLAAGFAGIQAWRNHARRQNLPTLAGKHVMVTGGSRGLGLAIVKECLKHGANVSFCSRTEADIDAAKQILTKTYSQSQFEGFACDIRIQQEVVKFLEKVSSKHQKLDMLINNAGVIEVGPAESMTRTDYERSLATHFWASLQLIEALLPKLRETHGCIANIASIGGRISVPHLLPYSVGKYALVGYSEGLAHELAKDNVSVTTVCPGLMRTGSAGHAWFKGDHEAEHTWFNIASSLPLITISAEEAARRILIAALKREAVCNFPWTTQFAVAAQTMFPQLTSSVLKTVNEFLPGMFNNGDPRQRVRGDRSGNGGVPAVVTTLGDQAAERLNEKAS